jgi:prepilin-type N-terminal cleavage/methylation domain-containing protein
MRTSLTRPSRSASGFTIIELLVVISIISLLISILLPALGAAREAAQMSQNLSNLRQIQLGVHSYAGDFKDYMPYRSGTPNTSSFTPYWGGMLFGRRYVNDPFMFWSPKRDTGWFGTASFDTREEMRANPLSSSNYQYTGYGANIRLMANAIDTTPAERVSYRIGNTFPVHADTVNQTPTDSEILVMTESVNSTGAIYGNYQARRGSSTSHNTLLRPMTWNGASVQAFLDGHVIARDSTTIGWAAASATTGSWTPPVHNHWARQAPWFRLN